MVIFFGPFVYICSVVRFRSNGPVSKNLNKNPRSILNETNDTIFEKLILQRIQDIEDEKNVDLTNTNQHGFKRGKSTTTAGLAIQSALVRALDLGQFALLYYAYYIVN